MTTARDIIRKALQKVGENFRNSDASSEEYADGLDSLNALISSYANDSMLIFARAWETFNLTPSQGTYTMGVGGNFNTSKPVFVVASYLKDGITDYPLTQITDEMYTQQITQKTTLGIPNYFTSDNANPLTNIRLYPVPDSNYQIFILTEKPLTEMTLDTEIILPAGWERMLIYNLAIEFYPEYGIPPDPLVLSIAKESKRLVRAAIIRNRSMDSNPIGISSGRFENGWMA